MRADAEIRFEVESRLQREPGMDDTLIGVIVRGGIVTLTGEAGHYGARWAAEDVVKRVPGVRAMANEIQVKLHEPAAPTDTAIAQSVADTLDGVLSAADHVQCVVQNGIVNLSGSVSYDEQKSAAQNAVGRLVGVKGLLNAIMTAGRADDLDSRHGPPDASP